MNFREWLVKNNVCQEALDWLDKQPDQSPEAIWATCPNGSWLLWGHETAGTPWLVLEPVVRLAVNRAFVYAKAEFIVTDADEYNQAEMAAWAAGTTKATRKARAATRATWAASAAGMADAARAAAWSSAASGAVEWWVSDAVEAGEAAEHQQCADDCRRLLKMPVMEEVI